MYTHIAAVHSRCVCVWCVCVHAYARHTAIASQYFTSGHWQFYVIIWCIRTASRTDMRRNRGREKFVFYQCFMSWNVFRATVSPLPREFGGKINMRGVISACAKNAELMLIFIFTVFTCCLTRPVICDKNLKDEESMYGMWGRMHELTKSIIEQDK